LCFHNKRIKIYDELEISSIIGKIRRKTYLPCRGITQNLNDDLLLNWQDCRLACFRTKAEIQLDVNFALLLFLPMVFKHRLFNQ
jgi:hypothetical protein